MSVFTKNEIAYFNEQLLGRLATANVSGQPHVVPVGFRYDPESDTIAIGGHNFAQSKKLRDIRANPKVAFVVDDLITVDPWQPRMIEIRGTAKIFNAGGEEALSSVAPGFDEVWVRITPQRINAFGIDPEPHSWRRNNRDRILLS